MGKRIVSKEVADAMEVLDRNDWKVREVVEFMTEMGGFSDPNKVVLNSLPVHVVVELMTEGYEVEKPTVEIGDVDYSEVQNIIENFELTEGAKMFSYRDGVRDGITIALEGLNAKIEGINK